ncbi:Sterol 24-C-methyltransferase [Hondaea fermentalgiana]|uniref:Sterol 24-C-methyltransferase n=1 Tax=Hondaea fermentalgiana TaxID=2315210 RepID=A0A2R5G662_9STRA|nr:Sterol 24-C-methyltransferase [Hondaea fermentalgiana]|eukprot:GBG26547.1 Sterol 24-C-methyltransferase [Hondaea fermentalgiana]
MIWTAWSWLVWLLDWFWWLTVKPSLYLLGAGTLWHLSQRWFYRLLARQIARPSGWFGRNVAHGLMKDLNSAGVAWAFARLPFPVGPAAQSTSRTDADADDDLHNAKDRNVCEDVHVGDEEISQQHKEDESNGTADDIGTPLEQRERVRGKRPRNAETLPLGSQSQKEASPALKILDVGCGGGLCFAPFLERFPDPSACVLEGLDISPEALEHCQEAVPDPERINLTLGSVEKLPWEDNSFDGVLAFHMFDIWAAADQEKRALAEMARCLRPGGLLALTTKEQSAYLRSAEVQAGMQQGICRIVTNAYVQAAIRMAGLEVIRQETQPEADCKARTPERDAIPIPSVLTIGRKPF